ncbi:MAG: hypothetical protein M5R41_19390 [Bacteroidia bacterium]|nr:hypothetical protein [Bacteroidia bacterium]
MLIDTVQLISTAPYIDMPLPPIEEWPKVAGLLTDDNPPPPGDEDAPPDN